jgi:hypothetical protein
MCAGERVQGPSCVRVREFREPHVCGSESAGQTHAGQTGVNFQAGRSVKDSFLP